MRPGVAALIAISLGCGTRDRTCDPAVDFIYRDARCGIVANGPGPCTEVGDGLCHLRCDSDGDCPSSAPNCRVLGLFQGGDFSCNASVRVCGHADRDECPISR